MARMRKKMIYHLLTHFGVIIGIALLAMRYFGLHTVTHSVVIAGVAKHG